MRDGSEDAIAPTGGRTTARCRTTAAAFVSAATTAPSLHHAAGEETARRSPVARYRPATGDPAPSKETEIAQRDSVARAGRCVHAGIVGRDDPSVAVPQQPAAVLAPAIRHLLLRLGDRTARELSENEAEVLGEGRGHDQRAVPTRLRNHAAGQQPETGEADDLALYAADHDALVLGKDHHVVDHNPVGAVIIAVVYVLSGTIPTFP